MSDRPSRSRIVVDARMLHTAGIGTYIAQTLPRVIRSMPGTPFTVLGDEELLRERLGSHEQVDCRDWRTAIYTLREQFEFARLIPDDTRVFWAPHFNIPVTWRGLLAVTVHDVAHLALAQRSGLRSLYARLIFTAVKRRASVVFCDSAFTERELRTRVGEPCRTVVNHLGVDERWFELSSQSPAGTPFLLYVGNVKPHKNLGRLLEAFARVAPVIPHRLIIAGRQDGMRTVDSRTPELAARLGARVEFTGHASPDLLERLVASCDALVLPSVYEGFGLPPLEALACGKRVAVSNAASLPEVCGPVADYFDPFDIGSIAASLLRVAAPTPDSPVVIERRREWARRFDWDCCAASVAAELSRLLAHDPPRFADGDVG